MKFLGKIKAVLIASGLLPSSSSIPSLSTLLLRLLLTCLVPGFVGVGILIYQQYEEGRQQIDKDTIHTARAIMNVVDGEFNSAKIVAISLSSSTFVVNKDWAGFHKRASDLIKNEDINAASVVLTDTSGQQLVNTLVPWGTPLPVSQIADLLQRRSAEGKIFMTHVFKGAVSGKSRVTIVVPIKSGNEVTYLLGVSIDTTELRQTLLDQKLPASWIVSISDDVGTIVARSTNNEKFVGQTINPEALRRLKNTNETAFESLTKEGIPSLFVFSRSPTSHWTVGIAVPVAPLVADLKRNLLLLGGCGLFLILIGAWFAKRLSNQIVGSVQALTQSAQVLVTGEKAQTFKPSFQEAIEASQAMTLTAELLRERAQALTTSQTLLQKQTEVLADAQRIAHIGSWHWDAKTDITTRSDEVARIFGRETIPPLAEQNGVLYPKSSWQRLNLAKQQAATKGTPFEIELPAFFSDGSQIWVSVRGEAMRSSDSGEIVGVRGSLQDITDRKRAEADEQRIILIEAENKQMQETSRLKSQFLANMSHELRTPLNAVIGFADLLHSGFILPDSPRHQEFLGHIGTAGRHLLQLINDVLDLSKVESGKFEFFPEPVDLVVILQEVQDVLHGVLSRKTISISSEIDPEVIDVSLDPGRLKQVLYNYLSNAIKFTPDGGKIVIRVMAQGPEHFRIEVEDTGIGISAANLPLLFSEFQQIDTNYNKQHQGTGLGLALTRRLVEAQGGKVGVRSTLGRGSVFYAILNRTHGVDIERAQAIAQGLLKPQADRMLVIEDDQRNQALMVEALSQAGFEVDSAGDGSHALLRARQVAYAAMTLDLNLQDQRGLELLDKIRAQGASDTSPVIGVTMPADVNNSAAFAIANVLCKPMRSEEVLLAMERFRLLGAPRANVMVIDDDLMSLDLMRATLKSIGIDAVCFQDGRVAMREIENCRPDAIVLDLMMPEFDGFQVLDALQRLPNWCDVPVFIWTSMLLTDEEYAILARSARAILIKGGGAMESVLKSLRRWRQPLVGVPEVKP